MGPTEEYSRALERRPPLKVATLVELDAKQNCTSGEQASTPKPHFSDAFQNVSSGGARYEETTRSEVTEKTGELD